MCFASMATMLALVLGGCDTEEVTGPIQVQVAPPTSTPASATYNITVSASPSTLDLNDGAAVVQITVTARRTSNNQPVPEGTTALLTTTFGTLTSGTGVGDSVPIQFDFQGVARGSLSTGTLNNTGVILVRAQIEGSFGATEIQVLDVEPAPFQVTGISPSSGPPSGNTPVTIFGSGFESPVRASFNVLGQTLLLNNVRVTGSTTISATTPTINLPSGQNAAATLTVENAFDSSGSPAGTDTLGGAFTYTRSSAGTTTLKLFSATPTFGPNEGGTQVTLNGEGFGNQVQVYFTTGPLIEATVLSITPTRLQVVTPSATGPNAGNANQVVDIIVRDPQTGQEAQLGSAFQYGRGAGGALFISSLSQTEDEYLGGSIVTIFGQGFEEPVAVGMGGEGQQIISVTGTEVVVRTSFADLAGCGNQTGAVSLTNIETNESTAGPQFTYVPIRPLIISISPSSGGENGGTVIDIQGIGRSFGRGFIPPLTVSVDGIPASNVQLLANDVVRATVPSYTGSFETETCTAGGATGTRQVPARVNVTVTNLDTTCNDTFSDGFSYIPADQSCVVQQEDLEAGFIVTGDPDGDAGTLDFQFDDQSTGNPTTIQWDFDFQAGVFTVDDTGSSVTHTYAVAGNYTVAQRVTRGAETDQATQTINAN